MTMKFISPGLLIFLSLLLTSFLCGSVAGAVLKVGGSLLFALVIGFLVRRWKEREPPMVDL